ncbi:MAG: helix-turn-helix domain-containing protein [Chloroflexota bacterium]|nr:helix-turn-helix domain-containing protein [Chloroflexota bacterium]
MALNTMRAEPHVSSADDLDDIEAYIATLDENERSELAAAGAAIDIAILLYRSREHRGLSQTEAAKLAGLHQQTVSRLERPDVQPRLDTIQAYLGALGYSLELNVIDLETGRSTAKVVLPPRLPQNRRVDKRPCGSR